MGAKDLEQFKDFLPLAWKVARDIWHPVNTNTGELLGMDLNDMRQVASLALFRALFTYDPNYGTPLSTYLYAKIKQRCIDVLRKVYGQRSGSKLRNGHRLYQEADTYSVALWREEPHHHELDADDVLDMLPPRLKRILILYYIEGYTMAQVGQELKITKGRVCQLHQQALEIMRRKAVA